MKLMEQHKGAEPRVVSVPKLCVLENEPGQMSVGTSHAALWQVGVPANDMGHEGFQVNVVVCPEKPGHVRVGCWLWTSALEGEGALRESRCSTSRIIELGKTAKVTCDRLHGGEHVRCWMEMVIKEVKEEDSKPTVWAAPPPRPCPGVCVPVNKEEAVFFDRPVRCGTTLKTAANPVRMSFTAVETARPCGESEVEGKLRELRCARKVLEVTCCGETKMTCPKMELKHPGSRPITVSVSDGQVFLAGDGFKAYADRVTTEGGCVVTLEGHVRLDSSVDNVTMKAGKVRVELNGILKTGVISNPSLIQE
jgi:hypothetical protein